MVRYYAGLLDEIRECLEKDVNVKQARAAFGFLCESILRKKGHSVEFLIDFYSKGGILVGTEDCNLAYKEISQIIGLQKKIGHLDFRKKKEIEEKFLICRGWADRDKYLASLPPASLERRVEEHVLEPVVAYKEEVKVIKAGFFGKIRKAWGGCKEKIADYCEKRREERKKNRKPLYKGLGLGCVPRIVQGAAAIALGTMLYFSIPGETKMNYEARRPAETRVEIKKNARRGSVYETPEEEMMGLALRKQVLEERSERIMKPVYKMGEVIRTIGFGVAYTFDTLSGVA